MPGRDREARIEIRGMTCTGCEEHVVEALTAVGAQAVTADFRRGEAHFRLPVGMAPAAVEKAIQGIGYEPGALEYLEPAMTGDGPGLGGEGQYDLVIIGSGGAAFSAAIQARRHGARVAMIERGTMGGTCVNIGCVPSKTLDIAGLNDVGFLTSTTALELKSLPRSLAVIGSGYIALELGQLYRHLGARVILMQRSERVLKEYEPEISAAVTRAMTRQGIELITGVRYERVEEDRSGKRVFIEVNGQKRVIEAEQLLVAAGRSPNTATLGLEKAGVKVGRRGEVVVDEHLRTSNPRVFAAGDVTLGPQFVYVAAYEGAVVADNALGAADRKVDLRVVPAVTFTNPAIATVGLTESRARAAGFEVKTSVLPLEAVPRALVNRETTGVFKLVADAATGRLLGAHVVAENAGDVIYAATLAVKFGLTIRDLKETLALYLTMAEGLKLAALTFDSDVSKLSCCAG
ncbi:MAG: FAD-dependent oxidoreductase [Actinobacteria bacterium]|nr:FAD-dependent oxidoreductase [Actinomycetota bacterium]